MMSASKIALGAPPPRRHMPARAPALPGKNRYFHALLVRHKAHEGLLGIASGLSGEHHLFKSLKLSLCADRNQNIILFYR
jgi:hypothetical protein